MNISQYRTDQYCSEGTECMNQNHLALPGGQFFANTKRPSGWFHIVLNYIGPKDGEGIKIFIKGAQVASDTITSRGPYPTGDGRIVVGKKNTDEQNLFYASVQVDELRFFNRYLTQEEISVLAT